MVDTTTSTTLSHSLRLAADLCDELQWNQGITWSSTNEIGLHPDTDADWQRIRSAIPGGTVTIQVGRDYECDRYKATAASGLRVTVYGPHRPLAEQQANHNAAELEVYRQEAMPPATQVLAELGAAMEAGS